MNDSNEMTWHEMTWNDMTWNDMTWSEMKMNEFEWDESDMKCDATKYMNAWKNMKRPTWMT